MMRLKRKNRTYDDIQYKSSGGLFDLFDNAVKETFRLNDAELDYISERMTDEELEFILSERFPSFSEKRRLMELLNKYLIMFEKNAQ